jgi:CTD small phosphatase-like protein 2
MYEIMVFTAGEKDYADSILDFIDPDRQIIKHRLYRHHCIKPEKSVYVKDLGIIKDRNLNEMLIVDNSIISFAFNLENGVPIKAFMGEKQDEELLFLVTFLEEIYGFDDVREHIQNTFKLKEFTTKYASGSKDKAKLMQNAEKSMRGLNK